MQIVSCQKCGQCMSWQIHAEYVTAGCPCGVRIAAQHVFRWQQIPALLRARATKGFGIRGKWHVEPLTALRHALCSQRVAEPASADACA